MNKEKKYKVLYTPGWFPTRENPNSAIFVKEHIKAIALYNDVIILYLSPENIKGFLYLNLLENYLPGVKTFELRINKNLPSFIRKILSLIGLILVIRRIIKNNRIDLINTCSILSIGGISAFLASKIFRLPLITNEHWSGYIRKNPILMKLIIKTLGKILLKNANIVCPVSYRLANAIKSLGIKEEKILVIPNVVETSMIKFKRTTLQENDKAHKNILFIGLNFRIKGLDFILDALEMLKRKRNDFLLEVIGGVNKNELCFYKKVVENKGLSNNVLFLGVKTKEEVSEHIEKCDFGVQPSLYETFGVSILEFLGKGKPVITSDISPINELVPKSCGILIPPKDVKALSNAIDTMLDNYHAYPAQEMIEYVKNNFSHERVGMLFTKVYSLINQRRI